MFRASRDPALELILSDYSLPHFDGLRAVRLLRERGLDIPFILVSGTIGEDIAVSAMKEGADDYLLKDRLARLGPAVSQALERRRLREEARRAEERLRLQSAALEAAANGVVITDRNGLILWVNSAYTQLTGYSAGGSPQPESAAAQIGPAGPGVLPETLGRRSCPGRYGAVRSSNRRKDGSLYTEEMTITPGSRHAREIRPLHRHQPGHHRAQAGGGRPAGKRRALPHTGREAAQDMIFVVNREGYLEFVNTFAASHFGLPAEAMVGKRLEAVFPPDTVALQREDLQQVFDTLQSFHTDDNITFPHGDVWLSTLLTPLKDESGRAHAVLGISRDITERKTAEAALAAKNEED